MFRPLTSSQPSGLLSYPMGYSNAICGLAHKCFTVISFSSLVGPTKHSLCKYLIH